MTLAGSDYLLRLTALAVSFVGFASVVVALLRALGSELTPLHMYFVRFFIEGGLGVAALPTSPVVAKAARTAPNRGASEAQMHLSGGNV